MKGSSVCLGLMFCNRDLPFLRLHVPYFIQAFGYLNIVAATDDMQCEAAHWLGSLGISVAHIEFHQHWSDFLNGMIDESTQRGFGKMIRLDPDELMWKDDVPKIDALLDRFGALIFPRHNFWYDRLRVNTFAWPDFQTRAWRLDGQSRYAGQRHEGLHRADSNVACISSIELFHYGDIGQQNIADRALRYYNYDRLDAGQPLVDKLPDDIHPGANTEPYTLPQPLDPHAIGLTAPFPS